MRKEALLEKEKLKKMTPEQRLKYEEKKKKQDMIAYKKRLSKMVKHWANRNSSPQTWK